MASIKTATAIVAEHQLTHCLIPHTEMHVINQRAILIMEKLPGVTGKAANQLPKAKLETSFRQAAEYICHSGYWDVKWDNLFISDLGIGFVDFENIEPDRESKSAGLLRLYRLAPPEFQDMLLEIGTKHKVLDQQEKNFLISKRQVAAQRVQPGPAPIL